MGLAWLFYLDNNRDPELSYFVFVLGDPCLVDYLNYLPGSGTVDAVGFDYLLNITGFNI